MKLGLFIPGNDFNYNNIQASLWIRALQMKKYFEDFGVRVYINNPFMRYDVIIYYRRTDSYSLNYIKYLKRISDKVYWDTCVNYFKLHKQTDSEQVNIAYRISEIVDGIIVSTDFIAERAGLYNKVFIMDDPINLKHFVREKSNINFDDPIFTWSGNSSKAYSLEDYKDLLTKLLIITDSMPKLAIQYKFYKWRYESFPYYISLGDIAFLPRDLITNYEYDMGHSSFKALVYAAQKMPIIANKLPSYKKLAEKYDGILFFEDYENVEEILHCLRNRTCNNKNVLDFYSCENQAFRLLEFLNFH